MWIIPLSLKSSPVIHGISFPTAKQSGTNRNHHTLHYVKLSKLVFAQTMQQLLKKRNANAVMPSWECKRLPDLAPSATFSVLCALVAIYIRRSSRTSSWAGAHTRQKVCCRSVDSDNLCELRSFTCLLITDPPGANPGNTSATSAGTF